MCIRFKPKRRRLVWLCCAEPTMHLSVTYCGISEIYWLIIWANHQSVVYNCCIIHHWSQVSDRTNIVLVCLCHWSICIIQVIFWYFINSRDVIWDVSNRSIKARIKDQFSNLERNTSKPNNISLLDFNLFIWHEFTSEPEVIVNYVILALSHILRLK